MPVHSQALEISNPMTTKLTTEFFVKVPPEDVADEGQAAQGIDPQSCETNVKLTNNEACRRVDLKDGGQISAVEDKQQSDTDYEGSHVLVNVHSAMDGTQRILGAGTSPEKPRQSAPEQEYYIKLLMIIKLSTTTKEVQKKFLPFVPKCRT